MEASGKLEGKLGGKLDGKTALVTGSGRGIGKAIALRLAEEGADVAVHYNRTVDGALEAVERITALGRRGHALRAELEHVDEARRLVAEAVAHFGGVDILVNNAGLEKNAPFVDVTEEDYDRVLDVNLKAVFFVTQAAVRHMRETGRSGRVINISSVHEELPFPNFAPYCLSKGGVRMLTRTLAVELRGTGITVNAIAPGAIETEINRALLADSKKLGSLLAQIPLGRLGRPEDIAGLAAFLASPDAAYVNGSTYFIDGGLTWFYEEQ